MDACASYATISTWTQPILKHNICSFRKPGKKIYNLLLNSLKMLNSPKCFYKFLLNKEEALLRIYFLSQKNKPYQEHSIQKHFQKIKTIL